MRVRIILSIIFLFNFYSSLAQLTIKGNITGFDHNKHIYLGSYIGDKLVPIDSCLILEDGKFEFSIEKDLIHHGLYEIR